LPAAARRNPSSACARFLARCQAIARGRKPLLIRCVELQTQICKVQFLGAFVCRRVPLQIIRPGFFASFQNQRTDIDASDSGLALGVQFALQRGGAYYKHRPVSFFKTNILSLFPEMILRTAVRASPSENIDPFQHHANSLARNSTTSASLFYTRQLKNSPL